MPKLMLGFPAVQENWKWLLQEGGARLEPEGLIMPVTREKKGRSKNGKRRSLQLSPSHTSCSIPP